jgi:hypothetical protein
MLTRSLERLLESLIRPLVGRLSLVRLEDLFRRIYVKEAERRLKAEFPSRRVTLSQLALMTGLDTRTLTKLTNDKSYAQPAHEDERFLNDMTPETRLISVWLSDGRFCDMTTGKPRTLSLDSGHPGFKELVSCLSSTRGITLQSVLSRLESAGSVEVDSKAQRVRLVANNFYPFLSGNESAMLDVGFSTTAHLLDTIHHNLKSNSTEGEKLFQRASFTYTLAPRRRVEFRRRLRTLLEESDDNCRHAIAELEENIANPGQVTAGVSMFYFESGIE